MQNKTKLQKRFAARVFSGVVEGLPSIVCDVRDKSLYVVGRENVITDVKY